MARVALVTCRELPEPDPDQDLLLGALRAVGLGAELLAWDDPAGDPSTFDLCVLRSCWNYYEYPDRFLAWCHQAAATSRLLNEEHIVRWNIHKRYLEELEGLGVPILPTVWFRQGESVDLFQTIRQRRWDEIVIKPAVSASSFETKRFPGARIEEAQRFVDESLRHRDTMVQQYMSEVERSGEKAVVWIDGQVTHAVIKTPRFAGGVEAVSDAVAVSDEERSAAERILSRFAVSLLYARVDLVRGDRGELLLSELELMEPSLFLQQSPAALARFVAAICRESGDAG